MTTEYGYSHGGGSGPTDYWNRYAYISRDDAVAGGIKKLIKTFEGIRDWKGSQPDSFPALAESMIEELKAHQAKTRQMALF